MTSGLPAPTPTSPANPNDVDRLIHALYLGAVEDGEAFRVRALQHLSTCFGAEGAAWLTVSGGGLCGEFSQWPADGGLTQQPLLDLNWSDSARVLALDPLQGDLQVPDALPGGRGVGLRYAHRGADLISLVLLRFARTAGDFSSAALNRAVGHAVEASTLSLRHFLQRDEWLHSMGRANRGPAALVDRGGTIYAASQRFRNMVGVPLKNPEFERLPCALPDEGLAESGGFNWGELYFRVSPHGSLYLLHVRAPLPLDGLSRREQEIARALGTGKTFKSVARQYDIAVSTVANHASRIYRKLGVYRREELVQLVRQPQRDHTAH